MSVQKVLQVTNPTLRQKSKSITGFDKKLERLITDLTDTLGAQKNPVGVGLAAPQIGKNVCVFVIKSGKNIIPFINPKIIWKSTNTNDPQEKPKNRKTEKPLSETREPPPSARRARLAESKRASGGITDNREYIMEGCLSLPHYYGPVLRTARIKVKYEMPKMENGKWKMENATKSFSGLPSQIIQHEIDHLNGLLFVDRLLTQKRKLFQLKGKEWEEVEL